MALRRRVAAQTRQQQGPQCTRWQRWRQASWAGSRVIRRTTHPLTNLVVRRERRPRHLYRHSQVSSRRLLLLLLMMMLLPPPPYSAVQVASGRREVAPCRRRAVAMGVRWYVPTPPAPPPPRAASLGLDAAVIRDSVGRGGLGRAPQRTCQAPGEGARVSARSAAGDAQ